MTIETQQPASAESRFRSRSAGISCAVVGAFVGAEVGHVVVAERPIVSDAECPGDLIVRHFGSDAPVDHSAVVNDVGCAFDLFGVPSDILIFHTPRLYIRRARTSIAKSHLFSIVCKSLNRTLEQGAAPNAGIASQASSCVLCPGIGELGVGQHHEALLG